MFAGGVKGNEFVVNICGGGGGMTALKGCRSDGVDRVWRSER